jgi:plasmid stabilization system protein ParE
MRGTFRLSRAAEQDLQQIADYWTLEAGEQIALRMAGGIVETIITLSGQPREGRLDPRFGVGIRKFACGDFMIYSPRAEKCD